MTHGREARITPRTTAQVVDAVGPRLRALRTRREITLSALSAQTGVSVSTPSRLESGQRRPPLLLGEHDLDLGAGEVVEFDTHTPHWIGNVTDEVTEVLCLYGPQGERAYVRSRPAAPSRTEETS